MMKKIKSTFTMLTIIALIVWLLGCQEGPVEKAGKKIDKVVEDSK
ncbi:MAG: hypothetical protein R6V76_13640 [Desulfobacterales bacterium]